MLAVEVGLQSSKLSLRMSCLINMKASPCLHVLKFTIQCISTTRTSSMAQHRHRAQTQQQFPCLSNKLLVQLTRMLSRKVQREVLVLHERDCSFAYTPLCISVARCSPEEGPQHRRGPSGLSSRGDPVWISNFFARLAVSAM